MKEYIYILRTVNDHFKVGVTKNVNVRLKGIQTSCPAKVELFKAYEVIGRYDIERYIHDKFSKFNTSGEWFKVNDDEIESFIETIDKVVVDINNGNIDSFARNSSENCISFKNEYVRFLYDYCLEHDVKIKTREAYISWAIQFSNYLHNKCFYDLKKITKHDVQEYVDYLTNIKEYSPSSVKQACAAITYFARTILSVEIGRLKMPKQINPYEEGKFYLTVPEITDLLNRMSGFKKLIVMLLYGCGLKLSECLSLRVISIDFDDDQIHVCGINGDKIRSTVLPSKLHPHLKQQISNIMKMHKNDIKANVGAPLYKSGQIIISNKLEEYLLFSSDDISRVLSEGTAYRQAVGPSYIQKFTKKISEDTGIYFNCNMLRHSFALHMLNRGYDSDVVRKLMGIKDQRCMIMYIDAARKNYDRVRSPLDSAEFNKIV